MQVHSPIVTYNEMGTKVREYRASMSSAYREEVAQLKAAREALNEAHRTGDKDAIAAARQAIADVQQQMDDNRAALKTLQSDVAHVREARHQLAADVRAKHAGSIEQDIAAFNEARDRVFTDVLA